MTKLVFVLIDGLDVASKQHMSYLAAHVERGASHGIMNCELPSISRPIYSSLFTGYSPLDTHITTNDFATLPAEIHAQSFFAKMRGAGYVCAMAAYYWMRELYCMEKYDASRHRLSIDVEGGCCPIPYGIFYSDDDYADKYIFQDAANLQHHYKPDFLLIHTMGVDNAGHGFGANSEQYRQAVRNVDMLLAKYAQKFMEDGSVVIVTSDHGMHKDGAHNDTLPEVRQVPYWILGNTQANLSAPQRQNQWHELLCAYFL